MDSVAMIGMGMGMVGSVSSGAEDTMGWLAGAIDWLGNLLDPVGEILTSIWPPVAAGIVAIVLLRTVRWLLLFWRGRTPRVQISSFAWASPEDEDSEAMWVTSLFREQLAALRLDALDPLPDRAPGAPLVEIVEGVGQGIGRSLDIGKALGRLFRAVWPDTAYEVWGTLREKEGGGRRISVQLIERRHGNKTLLNVSLEQTSWQESAREAAMAVAGALYPRVRKSDRGPWTLWTETVPRRLMGLYHDARRHEEADELEHALDAYHAALDLDPLNPSLRLKIAMLQERLELNLDAWVTYEAIVGEFEPRAWRGPNRRVHLLALYRLAVMLSNGRVADQWVKNECVQEGKGTLRDDERHKRRAELLLSLKRDSLFSSHLIQRSAKRVFTRSLRPISLSIRRSQSPSLLVLLHMIEPVGKSPKEMVEVFEQTGKSRELIDALLLILSLRRLEELRASLRVSPSPRRWRELRVHGPPRRRLLHRREFARRAVRTSELLVRIRVAACLEGRVDEASELDNRERWIDEIRQAHCKLAYRWPFPAATRSRRMLRLIAPLRWLANRRDDAWQFHYNAACATATVLRDDSVLRSYEEEASEPEADSLKVEERRALPPRIEEGDVVDRAISELEEYASRAGSSRVAAQADWLAIDDPDLQGLRETDSFKLWASHHLPRTLPPDLPTRKTDVKRFTVRVVHDGARLFASVWLERANRLTPSSDEIVRWWEEERRAWQLLGNACREHLSWQERLRWLRLLREWNNNGENSEPLDFGHETRGTAAAESVTEGLFERLAELSGARRSGRGAPTVAASEERPFLGWTPEAGTIIEWIDRRAEQVRQAHEVGERQADETGSLRHAVEREEALSAFRLWSRLADMLETELIPPHRRRKREELEVRLKRILKELPESPATTSRVATS